MKTTICLLLSLLACLSLRASPALAQSGYHPVNVPPGLHNPRLPSEHINYQPDESHPPGTPPCGHDFSPVPCYFAVLPGGFRPAPPMPRVFREEAARLRALPLVQAEADTRRFVALHPEYFPPHAPPPPGQPAALCPSCAMPGGAVWSHQTPLLVGGRLLRRTPVLVSPRPWRWTPKFALELAFWLVLVTGSTYLVTSYFQERNLRLHDERVAARAARARDRAAALEARRTLLGGG